MTPAPFRIALPEAAMEVTGLRYAAGLAPVATVLLAHGAGSDQRHPRMVEWAMGLAARGIEAVTFDFPYRERGRGAPDRMPVLEATARAAIAKVEQGARGALVIGGRSLGGRVTTRVAPSAPSARGLVLLGYPLHPPGRPGQLRVDHLAAVGRPMLFVQGTRDPFGRPEELAPHLAGLTPRPRILPVEGGDHALTLTRRAEQERGPALPRLLDAVAAFVTEIVGA